MSRELNELQDKVSFSHRRFLDKKLCGFFFSPTRAGRAAQKTSSKIFFLNKRKLCHVR
jgi:hypothetical protein